MGFSETSRMGTRRGAGVGFCIAPEVKGVERVLVHTLVGFPSLYKQKGASGSQERCVRPGHSKTWAPGEQVPKFVQAAARRLHEPRDGRRVLPLLTQALVNRTQALVNRTRALVNRTQARLCLDTVRDAVGGWTEFDEARVEEGVSITPTSNPVIRACGVLYTRLTRISGRVVSVAKIQKKARVRRRKHIRKSKLIACVLFDSW